MKVDIVLVTDIAGIYKKKMHLPAKCRKRKHVKDVEVTEPIGATPRFTTECHRAEATPVSGWQGTLV